MSASLSCFKCRKKLLIVSSVPHESYLEAALRCPDKRFWNRHDSYHAYSADGVEWNTDPRFLFKTRSVTYTHNNAPLTLMAGDTLTLTDIVIKQ